MRLEVGEMLLDFAARRLLPMVVEEIGNYAVQQVTRGVARSAHQRLARRPSLRLVPTVHQAAAPVRASHAARPPLRLVPPLAILPATSVVSHTPGRVRLQVAGVAGDPARAAAVQATLGALLGVGAARVSALTGNALIHYDPCRTSLGEIQTALEAPRALSG